MAALALGSLVGILLLVAGILLLGLEFVNGSQFLR